ncbi:hypothetical protein Tco_0329940, partial [Tanacetum coccineum]
MYTRGVLEKDLAPHLTARQEQVVQVLSSNKAPFRRYPECFLALVGLSPYYPFGENTYPAFEGPDRTAGHQASGSGSGAGAEVSAEGNVVEENVIPEGAFMNLTDPECDVT